MRNLRAVNEGRKRHFDREDADVDERNEWKVLRMDNYGCAYDHRYSDNRRFGDNSCYRR